MAQKKLNQALVLGAGRFLGLSVAKQLLMNDVPVSTFSPTDLSSKQNLASLVENTELARRLHVCGGHTADGTRLRQVIAQHEIDLIVQCEQGEFPEQTHALTHGVLQAAASSPRQPAVIVPLRREEAACRPRLTVAAGLGLKVAFIQLPELWGAGEEDLSRWAANQFARAALEWPLSMPARPFEVLHVDQASAWLASAASRMLYTQEPVQWSDVPGKGTCRDLLAALRDEVGPRLHGGSLPQQETVLEVLNWYRERAAWWRGRLQRTAWRVAA